MKRLFILALSLILSSMFCLSTSGAGAGITYNFDEVKVTYAAEFIASPVSAEDNKWFTELAGGKDKPLTILYGVVSLKTTENNSEMTEEFIKISGVNGSERFLLNSWSKRDGYEKSLLWSAKKLEGNTVVKDFSQPIKSVTLKKNNDINQKITSIELFFSDNGNLAQEEFGMETTPKINVYNADMASLNSFVKK